MKAYSLITAGIIWSIIAAVAFAASSVQGKYIKKEDTHFVMELTISKPVPTAIIVTQQIPPLTPVTESVPPFISYEEKKGILKWLLKDLAAGAVQISLKTGVKLSPQEVKGEIRFKDPASGKMVTRKIQAD